MIPLSSPKLALTTVALLTLFACEQNTLAPQVARIRIVPQPEGFQETLIDPIGLDLGDVPLYGSATAHFKIANDSAAVLRIKSAEVRDAVGGTFAITGVSTAVTAYAEDGELVVTFVPEGRDVVGSATIALQTNAGDKQDLEAQATVRGTGLWVGDPTLAVCVVDADSAPCDTLHSLPMTCADRGDGQNICTFDPIDFGVVALELFGTKKVKIANLPPAGTCIPPPGSPDCTPACTLVIDKNPSGHDVGFGFEPADVGFKVDGNLTVPFAVEAPSQPCGVAGEVLLAVEFTAGSVERDATATLRIESNDPQRPFAEIPLAAKARRAPVAIARLRPCDLSPPPLCSVADSIHPLDTVYLDGSLSYDQRDPADPSLISTYAWRVLEYPLGTDPGMFLPNGFNTSQADFFLPLAGRYLVHLEVGNGLGIQSGTSDTSDVEIFAVPTSRVHIQLTWDNSTNDQDLHLTNAALGDLVCDANADCFWGNCKPSCPSGTGCRAGPPQWFAASAPREGPNPRLDIDDTHGLGPENINIDVPAAGQFNIYVHYYGLIDLTTTPTRCTVRVYIDTQLAVEFHRTLGRNELWRVAQIQWNEDGSAAVVAAGSDGNGAGQVKTLVGCTSGFSFGDWY
jgi:hypothetical protein